MLSYESLQKSFMNKSKTLEESKQAEINQTIDNMEAKHNFFPHRCVNMKLEFLCKKYI